MIDDPSQLVCAWIDAYYTHRDEAMIPLAHPEIGIRPRVAHGARLYRGIDGLRSWLDYTRSSRSQIDAYSLESLPDGRLLAEAVLEGVPVVALFEIRDDKIAHVTMYISDREMLERLGEIKGPRGPRSMRRIPGVASPGADGACR